MRNMSIDRNHRNTFFCIVYMQSEHMCLARECLFVCVSGLTDRYNFIINTR